MGFLFYILVIILLIAVLGLRGRVDRLERMVRRLKETNEEVGQQPLAAIASVPFEARRSTPELGVMPHEQVAAHEMGAVNHDQEWVERFVLWMKEDWLLKLGGLLLLIGFGWLVSYAFLNNWIGPMGRIVLGFVAGAVFLVLGFWRIQRFAHQGSVFLVLGSTIVLVTTFAARELYDFFTPLTALLVMGMSVAFVALASVRFKIASLSFASLVLAGVAPLLTSSARPDFVGLFWYLLVVVLATLWIVLITGQRSLVLASLVMIALYQFPHLVGVTSANLSVLLLFAYAFAGIFFVVSALGVIVAGMRRSVADVLTAVGNGLLLLWWIMRAVPSEWQSLIIVSWVIVFLAGAFLVFRSTGERQPFYLYAGVSVAMLAAATAVELHGSVLTLAYTIECGIIPLAMYWFTKDIRVAERSSMLIVGPALMSFASMASPLWRQGVFHKDFFVILILGAILIGLGLVFRLLIPDMKEKESRDFSAALIIVGSVFFYILIWLSLGAALRSHDQAVMISLIIYTLIGLVTYFIGNGNDQRTVKLYGGVLLGFVVLRLLLVDVWGMALAGRIVTFFIVGALLMSTAFFGRKHKTEQQS